MSKLDVLKDITGGQMAALVHKLGGLEIVQQILQGKVVITTAEVIRKFFDKNGRGIPDKLKMSVCQPNTNFRLIQPEVLSNGCMATAFERAENYLGDYLGRDKIPFSDFRQQIIALHDQLQADESIANLLKGVWLPLLIPRMAVDDLGAAIETLAEAAGESYREKFPERTWINHRKGKLAGKVSIQSGSRHDRLISRMADGQVPAIYFPNPMQGFSINAQREFEQKLPETIALTGAIEPAVAIAMYPEVLAHSYNTPGYDCSALQYESTGRSLYFKAFDDELRFGYGGSLVFANDDYSGGLLFLG